jgi:hypothetical protein
MLAPLELDFDSAEQEPKLHPEMADTVQKPYLPEEQGDQQEWWTNQENV